MEEKYIGLFNFYKTTVKLKDLVRTGWKEWELKRDRLESVAEHIYGTQMLAIAMHSQGLSPKDIDIGHVIYLLAIHELGECLVGDITPFDNITKEEKYEMEVDAVQKSLSKLNQKGELFNLFLEFEKQITKEAKFAKIVDKLEADFQAKIYSDEGCVDLFLPLQHHGQEVIRKKYVNKGETKFSDVWIDYDIKHLKLNKNYKKIQEELKNFSFKD